MAENEKQASEASKTNKENLSYQKRRMKQNSELLSQGNEALNASRQSYANWEADQKIKMELRAKGQTVLFDKVYVIACKFFRI